jgi:hypothetical protein
MDKELIWIDKGRPGYLGRHRDERYAGWNAEYGEGNWRLVWKIGTGNVDFLGMCKHYEESYYRFLGKEGGVLEMLIRGASDVYDDAVSNVYSGLVYSIQETNRTHVQDIAIRNAVNRLGKRFEGKELIQIRDKEAPHPLSIILSPGQVPFCEPGLILQPELTGWWKPHSVEAFYQSNRVLQVIEKQAGL